MASASSEACRRHKKRWLLLLLCTATLTCASAAPASAEVNLALPEYGGRVAVSSIHSGPYYASVLNDGLQVGGAGVGYWNDATQSVWPDWAAIEWDTPQTINRIAARLPIGQPSFPAGDRTLRTVRVQYWDDDNAAFVDVRDLNSAPNPILDWETATTADPGQTKTFEVASITTTSIRVLIEDGSADGWSWLDEIEAYGTPCPPANLALAENGGRVAVSSIHSGPYYASVLNDGLQVGGAGVGYWNDATQSVWPDWAAIEWDTPQTINRIAARIPIGTPGFPIGDRTLRRVRVQYWDDDNAAFVDVRDLNSAPNPILDWETATTADPGQTKTFEIDPITTTRIRVLIEDGSADGWSWLDEIEAYGSSSQCANPNLALTRNGGSVTVSSELSGSFPAVNINDGQRRANGSGYGYWNDGTQGVWPDWAQIDWAEPQQIGRLVVRLPVGSPGPPEGARTLGRVRVQYWDDDTTSWTDVVDSDGAPNPVIDWISPTVESPDQTRTFSFPQVSTSRVRVVIEAGTTDGWSMLDEIEAYAR
jgi:hypothetical protein